MPTRFLGLVTVTLLAVGRAEPAPPQTLLPEDGRCRIQMCSRLRR
jgi:hypothetical protein